MTLALRDSKVYKGLMDCLTRQHRKDKQGKFATEVVAGENERKNTRKTTEEMNMLLGHRT